MSHELAWVDVQACTLPTIERPLRAAEFDAVFADHLIEVDGESATAALFRFTGGGDVMATLSELTARESQCCSFFGFELSGEPEVVRLVVTVPPAHAEVLAALVETATVITAGGSR